MTAIAPMDSSQGRRLIELLIEIRDRLPDPTTLVLAGAARRYMTMQQPEPAPDMLYGGFPLPPAKPPNSATIRDGLPDPAATPGAHDPLVKRSTIHATIGVPGWTATVRPPTSYTNALKRNKMVEYGLDGSPDDYELDHLIPLCCGGHPTDERNLWPQPRAGMFGARTKDLTEVAAQHAVLNDVMSLEYAQISFATNWIDLHAHLFGSPKMRPLLAALPHPEDEP
jgi:hypothetical protein